MGPHEELQSLREGVPCTHCQSTSRLWQRHSSAHSKKPNDDFVNNRRFLKRFATLFLLNRPPKKQLRQQKHLLYIRQLQQAFPSVPLRECRTYRRPQCSALRSFYSIPSDHSPPHLRTAELNSSCFRRRFIPNPNLIARQSRTT